MVARTFGIAWYMALDHSPNIGARDTMLNKTAAERTRTCTRYPRNNVPQLPERFNLFQEWGTRDGLAGDGPNPVPVRLR